jgi:hypothetical protein
MDVDLDGHRYLVPKIAAPVHVADKGGKPCGGRIFVAWHGRGYECTMCNHTLTRKDFRAIMKVGGR